MCCFRKSLVAVAGLLAVYPFAPTVFSQTPLVSHADTWRWHKGNTPLQSDWRTLDDSALDATWFSGPGAFGYSTDNSNETNLCRTILGDMRTRYTTVYLRKQFAITAPVDPNQLLRLTLDFDDGFIAWLDGVYLTSVNSPGSPNPPATNATATGSHESSRGNSGNNPQSPATYNLGPIGSRLGVGNHTLAIIGLNQSIDSTDFVQIADLAIVDAPATGTPVSGSVAVNTVWAAANNPYVVIGAITVESGVTLTIEPGVEVHFDQGLGMLVEGRLLAEGTPDDRILFTRSAEATAWGTLDFTGPLTNRLRFVDLRYSNGNIDGTGTILYLENMTWSNTTAQLVDAVSSSLTLLDCLIPGGSVAEPIHFSRMPANGHSLIKGCVFEAPRGYNDSVDFTGGNRPGPIPQFIDNVFLAAVDDCFDMDGTDAHIEGNIFMNVRQDAARDSSSNPISTGADNFGQGDTSQLVICRNIFYNCEHALLLKDRGSALMQNNTVVHLISNSVSRTSIAAGNQPIPPGLILFGEPWRGASAGAGVIFEGNIAYDLHAAIQATPFPLFDSSESFLVVNRSLIQGIVWPGQGNLDADPLFVDLDALTAANIRSKLALLPGSPCLGTGPNGLDMGALVPAGASISGEPNGTTSQTQARLVVAGPGIFAYRWRLNDGSWSPEVPLTTNLLFHAGMFTNAPPILLTNLSDGSYTVEVIGKNSAGVWQSTNQPTVSKTWLVRSAQSLRIDSITLNQNVVTLTFAAEAGKSYSVLVRDGLDLGRPWTKLRDVAPSTTGPVEVVDEIDGSRPARFYELVTPAR